MKEKRINEFKGVILFAAGLIILASLISFDPNDLGFYTSHPNVPIKNLIKSFGAHLALAVFFLFGFSSFIIPVFILWWGIKLFQNQPPILRVARFIGGFLFMVSTSSLIGLVTAYSPDFYKYGVVGFITSKFVVTYFGKVGAYILFSTLILLSLALVTEVLISTFIYHAVDNVKLFWESLFAKSSVKVPKKMTLKEKQKEFLEGKPKKGFIANLLFGSKNEEKLKDIKPRIVIPKNEKEEDIDGELEENLPVVRAKIKIKDEPAKFEHKLKAQTVALKVGNYSLPSLELLETPAPFEARQIKDDLTNNAKILEDTLADFGIAVKVTDIERGPIITRYELEPAPGERLNRIVALGDDIALVMKAQSVRIIAPIPGKGRVGIEVPNTQSSMVVLKEVLASKEFQEADNKLTLALGKDVSGKPVVADLAQMPHLLIAGTTGSGKTVCVNTIILSLLFRYTPDDLKMIMIDPKMVELAQYNGLPHLLSPVVTESKKASGVLNWLVFEMEHRYKLLSASSTKNISSYNLKNEKEKLPYIVLIIDEFADLMMVAREQVENAITRLAQLSRAVGIHLILATQRPSVDVITGVIKANLPARISFKVASKVDSRTVLDTNGADKLLGRGDMLFSRPEDSKLIRAQGALISDKEIEKVVEFIKSQAEPVYDESIGKEQKANPATGSVGVSCEKDQVYDEAVRLIMETNQASVSVLQRRMRLGYARAGRLIDMMEEEGLIGAYEGSKPRRILVDRKQWLNKYTGGSLGEEEETVKEQG